LPHRATIAAPRSHCHSGKQKLFFNVTQPTAPGMFRVGKTPMPGVVGWFLSWSFT
jgi:hypothetical protein